MKTVGDRFWVKVDKNGPSGCWLWLAYVDRFGYGRFAPFGNRPILAHRFSYEFAVAPIPTGMELDHICHNHGCVNPEHLRLATHAENSRNRVLNRDNTSGYKGVSWNRTSKKWRAMIQIDNKPIHLGLFGSPEAAYAVYCDAAKRLHGVFANFGRD